jgi:hypothetical protein
MQNIQSWDFTAPGTGAWKATGGGSVMSSLLTAAGSGSVSAAGVIEVTNNPGDPNGAVLLFTLSAAGTNGANDSKADQASWPFMRARCTALAGTTCQFSVSTEL